MEYNVILLVYCLQPKLGISGPTEIPALIMHSVIKTMTPVSKCTLLELLVSAQLPRALPQDERAGRDRRRQCRLVLRRQRRFVGVLLALVVGALRVQHKGAATADKVGSAIF